MRKVVVIQHMAYETPGTIGEALEARGVSIETIRVFEGAPIPAVIEGADGLIVMGGPMSICHVDRYPTLRDELKLIEKALATRRPVLGVCLGSQLLATVLGGTVSKGLAQEIGWFPVSLTDAGLEDPLWQGTCESFVPFHWHGDVFSIPPGAVALASSEATANQAYRYGRNVYGFQFHMEVTESILEGMVADCGAELEEAGVNADDVRAGATAHGARAREICWKVTNRWGREVERAEC